MKLSLPLMKTVPMPLGTVLLISLGLRVVASVEIIKEILGSGIYAGGTALIISSKGMKENHENRLMS